jgi:hypothetical protein
MIDTGNNWGYPNTANYLDLKRVKRVTHTKLYDSDGNLLEEVTETEYEYTGGSKWGNPIVMH